MPKKTTTDNVEVDLKGLKQFCVNSDAAEKGAKIHTRCCSVVQAYANKDAFDPVDAKGKNNEMCKICAK